MTKVLARDYTNCHGCRQCEAACGAMSELRTGSSLPRVRAISWDLEGWGVAIGCLHCEDAPCKSVCPREAIFVDDELNRVMVDYDKCIGCRTCVAACPFGAMEFDAQVKRVVKCDLCDGDPVCAKLCSYGAIRYVDEKEESAVKAMDVAEKLRRMMTGVNA